MTIQKLNLEINPPLDKYDLDRFLAANFERVESGFDDITGQVAPDVSALQTSIDNFQLALNDLAMRLSQIEAAGGVLPSSAQIYNLISPFFVAGPVNPVQGDTDIYLDLNDITLDTIWQKMNQQLRLFAAPRPVNMN